MNNAIPSRRLGASSLQVSAIGLGCMGMSEFYGPSDPDESLATLRRALDLGVNFLDTADMYGSGANERLLSTVLRERRSEIVIATKFGNVRGPNGEFAGVSGRPEYVAQACDASLARLGVDCIDLYYQHRVDPEVPIEETVGAMARLVAAGKVRYLGLSEASGRTLRRAQQVHPIAALQSEYSLWSRDIESDALPACRELGIALVAYSPLGRGYLTGAIGAPQDLSGDDFRLRHPRFQAEAMAHNARLLAALRELAEGRGITPAQLALAWLLGQGDDIVPIPGTRHSARLVENVAATRIVLDDAARRRIAEILASIPVQGHRYPEAARRLLNA